MRTPKHESTSCPGLHYWAMNDADGAQPLWIVVAAVGRNAPSEAFDDWFATFEEADRMARDLAEGRAA